MARASAVGLEVLELLEELEKLEALAKAFYETPWLMKHIILLFPLFVYSQPQTQSHLFFGQANL